MIKIIKNRAYNETRYRFICNICHIEFCCNSSEFVLKPSMANTKDEGVLCPNCNTFLNKYGAKEIYYNEEN